MVGTAAIVEVLGLSGRATAWTTPALAEALEEGLPADSVERVCRLIAPDDPTFKHTIVSRATWARRKRAHRLSLEESERVERLARLWAQAVEVWGSEEAARWFLWQPHPLLAGRRPIDLARTAIGAREVEQLLGGLEHGTAV